MTRTYLRCPGCNKKGVYLKLGAEDCWVCRYCEDFYAYNDGHDDHDLRNRAALAKLNPDKDIWVSDFPLDPPS